MDLGRDPVPGQQIHQLIDMLQAVMLRPGL